MNHDFFSKASRHNLLILFIFFGLIQGCSSNNKELKTELSGNRKMGLYLKVKPAQADAPVSSQVESYFRSLLVRGLDETYSPQIEILDLADGGLLESPESLYEIAHKKVDDIFIVELNTDPSFEIPSFKPSSEEIESLGEQYSEPPPQRVQLRTTIYNGANLRAVTVFQFSAEGIYLENFEKNFLESFNRSALDVFRNPNIYPKSDPLHYANLLYIFGQQKERQLAGNLSCENAESTLRHYSHAKELYEAARMNQAETTQAGIQAEAHELSTRLDESAKKSEVLNICKQDMQKKFSVEFEFGSMAPENQAFIMKAFEKVKFEDLLRKYTNKPIRFVFSLINETSLQLDVYLRFDQSRYKAWTAKRIPPVIGNYHILSLDPYFALMQTMVYFKSSLPPEAPRPLRTSFESLPMSLHLDTILSGAVSLGVQGKYLKADKRVSIGYPKSLLLSMPGFEDRTVSARSDEIFQEKAWIALSSCKTLDGVDTEDGLLMKFFGLRCSL